jgi:hypothetical protein
VILRAVTIAAAIPIFVLATVNAAPNAGEASLRYAAGENRWEAQGRIS